VLRVQLKVVPSPIPQERLKIGTDLDRSNDLAWYAPDLFGAAVKMKDIAKVHSSDLSHDARRIP